MNTTFYTKMTVGLGAVCATGYALSNIMYGSRRKEEKEPEIIRGSAFYGCLPELEGDMKSYLEECREDKGDIFTLRMGNDAYTTFIMDNKMMKRVLHNKHSDWNRPSKAAKLRFGLNEVVEAENGTQNLTKALHFGFAHPQNRNKLIKAIEIETKQLIKDLISKQKSNGNGWNISKEKLHAFIRNIVVKIELMVLFGSKFADDEELINLYFDFEESVPLRINGKQRVMTADSPIGKLLEKINFLCTQYEKELNDDKLKELPHGIMIANDFCEKNNFSKDQRNRLIVEFLWASLSNSSHTLSWMGFHILSDKICKNKVLNELKSQSHIFNVNKDDNAQFKLNEIRSLLPTLSSLINEVFRFYGQSNIFRYLLADIKVKDSQNKEYKLRAGDWVAGSSSFLHKNPKYFKNPNQFKFDRFMDTDTSNFNKKQAKNLFTFGSKCVGRSFAENLIVIICGFLMHNLEFEIVGGNKNVPRMGDVGSFSVPSINEEDDVAFKWRARINESQ